MIQNFATHLTEDTLEFVRIEKGMVDAGHLGLTHTVDQGQGAAAGKAVGKLLKNVLVEDAVCHIYVLQ